MTKPLGLLVFKGEEDIPKFKKEFGFEIKNKYLMKHGKTIHCNCCDKPLRTFNLGSILPYGSKIYYCDDPTCLAEYVSNHLEE